MATVTSSRRRNERGSGSKKVAASTPKPRQTSVGNRGAQAGPLKPGTRTSGTPMVNSSSATMRQIQAKAEAARSRAQGQPGIKGPIKLPNSQRAGTNLPSQGANALSKPRPSTPQKLSPAGRSMGGAMKGAGSAAIYTVANAALSPLARKAGMAIGKSIKGAMTPKPTKKASDSFGGQYQKGKAAPSKAPKMSKAKSFDNAFASARNSGMKTFTWEGKTYNTKKRGEK